jgi:hypothetical protein
MSTFTEFNEDISESNDFTLGNLSLEEENYNLDEIGSLADRISTSNYFVNINKVDKKAFDDVFPFIKHTLALQENGESKVVLFKTKKHKKRGRKKSLNTFDNFKKTKRKTHCKTDDDNVRIKIQVHFLTFVINITNDVIDSYFQAKKNGLYFRQINYFDKKNITLSHISRLKDCSIKDILQKIKITPKCRKQGEDYNKDICDKYLKLIEGDESLNWINDFFNMNYLDLFGYYYTYEKKSDFVIRGRKINYSTKTKPFYDLLEKNRNDEIIQECFKKISKQYFYRPKQQSQKIFSISKTK